MGMNSVSNPSSHKPGHPPSPLVSIIIPVKNEEQFIAQCLDAVFAQEASFQFEIIVIDSGSTDRTLSILEQYSSIRLIKILPQQFGHGKTRNLGASVSNGTFIVFLNADAIPLDNHWLQTLIHPLLNPNVEKIAGVFSRHVPRQDCHLYMYRDLDKSMPTTPFLRTQTSKTQFMIFSTVSCAIPRSLWQQFPFDDSIAIAEDQQWASTLLKNQYSILYQPASVVTHSHNYTHHQLFRIKCKVGQTENKFTHSFTLYTIGLLAITTGFLYKFISDIFYILVTPPTPKSFSQKCSQIKIALLARLFSFSGRFRGWITQSNTQVSHDE